MTNSEFQSVAVVLLPALHSQAVTSCKAFLPANAGLLVQSAELTARYATSAERERTAAGDILARLLAKEMPVPMTGSAILPFIEGMVPAMLAQEIDAEACEVANNIWTPSRRCRPRILPRHWARSCWQHRKTRQRTARTKQAAVHSTILPFVPMLQQRRHPVREQHASQRSL